MPFKPGEIPEGAKPFKKNDPRINRSGRPKMPNITEALKKVLNEEKDGMKALDAVLTALRNKAIKGDVRAIQELLDRAYGKSKQSIDHTTNGKDINKVDLSKLTDDELKIIAELQRKSGTGTA